MPAAVIRALTPFPVPAALGSLVSVAVLEQVLNSCCWVHGGKLKLSFRRGRENQLCVKGGLAVVRVVFSSGCRNPGVSSVLLIPFVLLWLPPLLQFPTHPAASCEAFPLFHASPPRMFSSSGGGNVSRPH